MKISTPALIAVAVTAIFLTGCSRSSAPQAPVTATTPTGAPQTALGRMAATAIGEARTKLAKENINLNGQFFSNDGHHNVVARVGHKDPADTRPDAELTPTGELLIDGRPVQVTPSQHALLVQYRQSLMSVAEAGMQLGVQGADLGGQAIGEVFEGLMSGHPDQIDKNINAKARKIEAQAMQLCTQLRPLQQLQQQLAAAVPQFAPYATLKASDIDDCGKHRAGERVTVATDADRAEIRDEIRERIRGGIRDAVRSDSRTPSNEAEEADDKSSSPPAR
jgi:hypothetical protein